MRGDDTICGKLFSYIDLEKRILADHPLRVIWGIANAALNRCPASSRALFADRPRVDPAGTVDAGVAAAGVLFDPLGTATGRADRLRSVVPLVRWAGDRGPGVGRHHLHQEPRPAARRRHRRQFLAAVLAHDKVKALLSSEHFSVDGTLLEAWASPKSFRPKDGSGDPPGPGRNGERDFHGEPRPNDTHASTTDPDARLYRKGPGKEARLASWAMR